MTLTLVHDADDHFAKIRAATWKNADEDIRRILEILKLQNLRDEDRREALEIVLNLGKSAGYFEGLKEGLRRGEDIALKSIRDVLERKPQPTGPGAA